MAEFDLTPEAVNEAAENQAAAVAEEVQEVAAQAAAMDMAPMIDLEQPEEVKQADSLAQFTEDEKRQINSVAERIDITDSNAVLGYGASAQRKVSDFADGALQSVRAKDMGETGQVLSSLLVELKHSGEPKKGFLGGLFSSASKQFEELKTQYSTTEQNVDRLVKLLEGHEEQLLKDIVQLDKLYDKFREWNGTEFSYEDFEYATERNNRADALANEGIDELRDAPF